jgi:glucose/arabinose dehydrogenase
MGDGGGGRDPDNLAQDPTTLLGKISRIDVTADDFPSDPDRDYAIPAGNTFANAADGRAEIFAIGLRNPYRSSFDPDSGDLLIADVGQNAIEEVSRLPMDDSSLNFGWRFKEGTQDYIGTTTETLTPPVIEYSHGNGPRQGRSITGGVVYTGPVEALQNAYLFADFISDNVWAVPEADMTLGSTVSSNAFQILTDTLQPDAGALSRITSFSEDADRNLYITTIGGDIFRMEAENP